MIKLISILMYFKESSFSFLNEDIKARHTLIKRAKMQIVQQMLCMKYIIIIDLYMHTQ